MAKLDSSTGHRDGGVPRGPGGPPHRCMQSPTFGKTSRRNSVPTPNRHLLSRMTTTCLERDSRSELDQPGVVDLAGDYSEARVGERGIRRPEVGGIGGIEGLDR